MSRLIKSQWSQTVPTEKKVIGIKILDIPEPTAKNDVVDKRMKSPMELIDEAKKEAEQIRQRAKIETNSLHAKIQQEREKWEQEKEVLKQTTHEEGFQAGMEEGIQQGYIEYQDKLSQAAQIIDAAKADYTAYIETSEKTIIDLAAKIAEKIVGTKIEESKDFFVSLVKKALKEVKEYPEVQLHVHPNHYEYLLAQKEELVAVFAHETNLFIYPDGELSENSCLIKSANGLIDASIDMQLSEIKQKLIELLESEPL